MRTKNIIQGVLFAFIAFSITACEKKYDTDELSRVTYFPDFVLTGDATIVVPFGGTYSEPGIIATENGGEIAVETTIVGDYFNGPVAAVNTNATDRYLITYSAINSDGYPGTAERLVYVINTGDLTTSIEGLYTSTILRNGVLRAGNTDMEYVMITKTGDNTYLFSDDICGYYDMGRGYGSGYRAHGIEVTANNIGANDFSYTNPGTVGGFGGATEMYELTVDAGTKTITLKVDWDAGPYTFEITLKQVQF